MTENEANRISGDGTVRILSSTHLEELHLTQPMPHGGTKEGDAYGNRHTAHEM